MSNVRTMTVDELFGGQLVTQGGSDRIALTMDRAAELARRAAMFDRLFESQEYSFVVAKVQDCWWCAFKSGNHFAPTPRVAVEAALEAQP